jgi:hypothetical protein
LHGLCPGEKGSYQESGWFAAEKAAGEGSKVAALPVWQLFGLRPWHRVFDRAVTFLDQEKLP